ncbi:hypothetical protein QUA00_32360 [Microcoleus sp. T2B6]|uniref:hypothetical protein n=1 Tax=Microcoleus sp. T2B6 TaxID=3055424 RepID=UPI002FD17CDF
MNNAIAVRSPSQLDPDTHTECLEFIRTAIASNDRQTALDIKNVLAEVCASGYADRAQIWADLTDTEQQNFKELLALPPIALPEPAPETTPATTPEPEPAPETPITPADAKKMREIATVWWDEFYGEQLQNLLTQMFGWQAPGTKYDATTINAWLVTEDAIVRDRIGELWQLKHGEGLIDSLDCGF